MAQHPLPPNATDDAADVLKARLRGELRLAMRAKEARRVRVLRALIAALDNAQAVPPEDRHTRYEVRSFGDRSAEVERLRLGETEVGRLLTQEITARTEAADQLLALGQIERAAELRAEAAVVAQWVQHDV